MPADLRSALYRALARLDGLTVSAGVVNLDGRPGTALGIDDDLTRKEIVVDPATGTFIGEREVVLDSGSMGLPDGTQLGYSAVRTAVVDDIVERP